MARNLMIIMPPFEGNMSLSNQIRKREEPQCAFAQIHGCIHAPCGRADPFLLEWLLFVRRGHVPGVNVFLNGTSDKAVRNL